MRAVRLTSIESAGTIRICAANWNLFLRATGPTAASSIAMPSSIQAWIDEFANDELKPEKGNALQPGMQLGVYRITDTLGAGGMGEVYRARDTRLDRDVAIKVLPSAFAGVRPTRTLRARS